MDHEEESFEDALRNMPWSAILIPLGLVIGVIVAVLAIALLS